MYVIESLAMSNLGLDIFFIPISRAFLIWSLTAKSVPIGLLLLPCERAHASSFCVCY